jgi:uncharacterized membrane protein
VRLRLRFRPITTPSRFSLSRTFFTGAIALLPLVATVLVLWWLWRVLLDYLGPRSWFGQMLSRVTDGLTDAEWAQYALGLVGLVVIVFALGLVVEVGVRRGWQRLVDAVVTRIPVVRTIYDVVQKLVGLFAAPQNGEARSMRPVWLHFGGVQVQGTKVLALLASAKPVALGGVNCLAVLIPTAPVPVGGGLIYVPEAWVEPADVGIEGLTSIYVSMGVTTDDYVKSQLSKS